MFDTFNVMPGSVVCAVKREMKEETGPAVKAVDKVTPENFNNPEVSGEPVLPLGNGTLLEDVLDENVNRQFLTI